MKSMGIMKLHLLKDPRVRLCLIGISTCIWSNFIQNIFSQGVNFINILRTFFLPIFWRQKLQSWNVSRESCAKSFHTKNVRVKCWWNWLKLSRPFFHVSLKNLFSFSRLIQLSLSFLLYLYFWFSSNLSLFLIIFSNLTLFLIIFSSFPSFILQPSHSNSFSQLHLM